MRKILSTLVASLALASGLGAAQAQSLSALEAEGSRLWFVELSGAPVADGSTVAAVQAEKAAFRTAALQAGIRYTERRSFDTLFNGLSVDVHPADRAKLSQIPGVKAIYPVQIVRRPDPERVAGGASTDMASAVKMTGADIMQNVLGMTGAGVKVAVMDTGIDIDHPDFGGTGVPGTTAFPSARVAYGWDFVGDAYNADPTSPTYNPVATPDPIPDDCAGHGTHVAGIIGANGQVRGVAPGVTFGASRVFGCEGSTEDDIMLAAMERAHADGMQVLNMSIGSPFTWPQSPTGKAASRLVNHGMVVVASIGNSGANGLYSVGAPGVGKNVIGVASFDNVAITLPQFTVSPDNTAIGYTTASAAPNAPTSGSFPMSRTGSTTTTNDACAPLPAGSLAGTIALIRRGSCGFYVKAFNAQTAGAVGVVLYNNVAGRINPTVAGTPPITIPVVSVSDTEGALINGRLAAGPVTMTWTSTLGTFPNPTGNLISSFSSYGLAPDLTLKPDIGAPGGLIFSTYPLELGGYTTLSGTSMASPHVAGGAALMLQWDPRIHASDMDGRLQNSATPRPWWGAPGLGFLDNVHRQGAGMLNLFASAIQRTTVEPSDLSLGESEGGPVTRTLTIRNRSATPLTYDIGHAPALATGPNTFTPSFFDSFANVTFSSTSVTVPARGSATVDVTVAAPADADLADRSIYGGYVTLTQHDAPGVVLRVPYAGFKGDYQSITVLTPTANGFPWLAKLAGGTFTNQPAGASYTLIGDDIPQFLVHLDHQSARMKLEAFDALTWKSFNKIDDEKLLTRNSTATGFFALTWDGTTFRGNGQNPGQWKTVPNGRYVVRLSVLKALGDEDNPAHWETWTSPVVTIARP
ncbi:MAG: S8 family serine peptidase [Rhizobacter sp.]